MLQINDLSYRLGDRLLFDAATAQLPAKTKAGLVGRNGAGKSTLFRLIKAEIAPDLGEATIRKGARVAFVDQEAPGGDRTVMATVLAADIERAALMAEAETAREPARIAEIETRLADIEAHAAEARAGEILAGLGFSHADQNRPCSDFSGGWRMRVALGAALFARPDLLLLDEPTNYLDLEGAVWLEGRLKRFDGAALVISHDRDLLNAAVDQIWHLRQAKLFVTPGGYDVFERRLADEQTRQLKLRARQESERQRLQAFVDRFRAKATKARQAQSRVKRLEKMTPVATLVADPVAPFDFPTPTRALAPPLLRLEGAAAGYDPDHPVLRDLDLRVDGDDRIGVLGRNGAGKTTLAKLLSGRIAPLAGRIGRHKKLNVAYFAQHQIEDLHPGRSAYDHVRERMPDATEAQRRARLGRLGLPQARGDTPAQDLSGGEKARLLMGLVTFEGPHVLILDEPTNHLDMDARAALIDALNAFEGAVILISHDRHLLETCADRLWLAADGRVTPFEDDLEAYRRHVSARPARERAEGETGGGDARAARRRASAARRADLAPLRKEAARWERESARLQEVIAVIDKGLASPDAYAKKPQEAAELARKRARASELLDVAENRWLEAAERLDALSRE